MYSYVEYFGKIQIQVRKGDKAKGELLSVGEVFLQGLFRRQGIFFRIVLYVKPF